MVPYLHPPVDIKDKVLSQIRATDLALSAKALEAKIARATGQKGYDVQVCPVGGMARSWVFTGRQGAVGESLSAPMHEYLLTRTGRKVTVSELSIGQWFEIVSIAFRWDGRRLAGLSGVRTGNWTEPLAVVYEKRSNRWRQLSTQLTSDEVQIGFFDAKSMDALCLVRSYDTRGFEQPHAGPLLTRRWIWRYRDGKYVPQDSVLVHNALYAFDELIVAVQKGDKATQRRICPDPRIVDRIKPFVIPHCRGVDCPGSFELDDGKVFGFRTDDDQTQSPFFEMGKPNGHWQVIRVETEHYFIKRDHIDVPK
ncbi:MAG: hypothetical protein P4L46_19135 [Fimbriimonas sp.]|nr:hypothetical protein [Fimbriimonas sp.]